MNMAIEAKGIRNLQSLVFQYFVCLLCAFLLVLAGLRQLQIGLLRPVPTRQAVNGMTGWTVPVVPGTDDVHF